MNNQNVWTYLDIIVDEARKHPTLSHRQLLEYVDKVVLPAAADEKLFDQMVGLHYLAGNWINKSSTSVNPE